MCAAYQLLLDRRWDPKAVAKEATEDDVYSKDSHAGTWGSSATIPATLRGFRKNVSMDIRRGQHKSQQRQLDANTRRVQGTLVPTGTTRPAP